MSWEIAVVGHTDRYEQAQRLARRVFSTCLCIDDGRLGAGRNHLRAWRWLADSSAEWCIVLEDDAVPSDWFMSGDLKDVLMTAPSPVISMYLGRQRPPHWQQSIATVIGSNKSWLMANELLHHVAVAVRTSFLPIMLDNLDKRIAAGLPIDEAIGDRLRQVGTEVAYCNPSIVNHDDSLPTVIHTHLSQHSTEKGVRTAGDGRTAWNMIDVNATWDDSRITIPTPLV